MPVGTSAIIGGSTGYLTAQSLDGGGKVIRTPFGPSAPIHKIDTIDGDVYFLSRHGESGYTVAAPYVNYRANIWALKELGVRRIVAWSGPGAIDPSLEIGELVVPADIIDETRGRGSSFFENTGLGFLRQNPPFCPCLTGALRNEIVARGGRRRESDVYVCTQGPRLETPAEIRKFASYGATLVGMTVAPECFLARELEICYCPICYVTNYAEGVIHRTYEPGKLFEGLLNDEERTRVDAAARILPEVALAALTSDCQCQCSCRFSMERYRRRGDIGEDWHTWIEVQGSGSDNV
jgi:5'-methylthioadenosine phosphorylase